MRDTNRRKLDVSRRVADFSRAHPDPSAGHAAAAGRIDAGLAQADELVKQQRDGILLVRSTTGVKRELRHAMVAGHLKHLVSVARQAAVEVPELARRFVIGQDRDSYATFRTAVHGMVEAATAQKELLVKYGLSEPVLGDLEHLLDKFETAIEQGDVGRRMHVGATARLAEVADGLMAAVAVLDGINRVRFAADPEALAVWESAISLGTPVRGTKVAPDTPPASGEVKPAA